MSPVHRRYPLPYKVLATGALLVTVAGSAVACGSSSSGAKAGSQGGISDITVTLTNDDCTLSPAKVRSGPLTFHVTNTDATAVNEVELRSGERIVGEKENLAPGFQGDFSLNLGAGSYSLYCPGASNEFAPLTVTGKPAATTGGSTSAVLTAGTKQYGAYITSQLALLVKATVALQHAIDGGELAAAQQAYGRARPYYERVEPVAETFTLGKQNLDADIDARINDVKDPAQWQGFHRIERALFADHSVVGMKPYAAGLVHNIGLLQRKTTGLSYQPAELANGAVGLLNEVERTKITGEEERYSHIDIVDFQANIEGSEEAFADIEPGLKRVDASLASTITARFASVDALLDHYRSSGAVGGFVPYGQLKASDKHNMAQRVQAVVEPLSQVAAKIVSA